MRTLLAVLGSILLVAAAGCGQGPNRYFSRGYRKRLLSLA